MPNTLLQGAPQSKQHFDRDNRHVEKADCYADDQMNAAALAEDAAELQSINIQDNVDVENAGLLKPKEASSKSPQDQAAHTEEKPQYRTRWLYFMCFIYYSCGARFMSLYYRAEGLDDSQIGTIYAVGSVSGTIMSTFVGLFADHLSRKIPAGRYYCMAVCVVIGGVGFTLQAPHIPRVSRYAQMLMCRVITNGCTNSMNILADAITVQCLADRKNFGRERLYGAVSWAIMHLLLGFLLDRYGRVVQHLFIFVGVFLVLASLWTIGAPPSEPDNNASETQGESIEPGRKPQRKGLAALADLEALSSLLKTYIASRLSVAFFVYAICLGYGMTQVENLVFMLFQDLGGTYFLCGVSVVVTVVFEIPLFNKSKAMLDKFGVAGMLVIGGLCYSFRVIGYTLCPGGWYAVLFEPMHGITIATVNTAQTEFIASITPGEFAATGQALLAMVKSGFGSTLGNWLGGLFIETYGETMNYRVSATIVMIGLAMWICTQPLSNWKKKLQGYMVNGEQPVSADAGEDNDMIPNTGSNLPVTLGRQA